MNRFLLLLCLSVALCSCFSRKKTITLEPVTISAKTAGMDIYRASAPRIWDITHARIALRFNLPEKTADGRIWMKLHPYAYAQDSIVLDAKSMEIHSITMEDENGRKLPFNYSGDSLTIRLGKTYYTRDTIQLFISYKAMPYATPASGSIAITEDRGLYFINTDRKIPGKPVQIWTQGETESNSHWMPTFDKPNERFTVRLELTVPDSFETLGNGYMSSQMRAGKGLRTDTWDMDKPIQAYAVMFAIGDFAIVKDSWRNREVNYYVEPAYAPYARDIFRNTPEMMEYFSTITGVNYPWNKYSQVVVRDYVSGAMENTTATLFGEFVNETSREIADVDYEDIVSHELFHQWFGDYVTAESWSNLTVNESFANYGEQLWRRHKYGDASADKLAYDDLWKFLGAESSESTSPPLVRFKYGNREDMFDRISYEKGGAILNYMHQLMGDTVFYKAMNIYLTKNALQSAEATNWRLAVEEASGKDWNWFFNQWYYRGGYPKLDVQYNYDDAAKQLYVTATQKQDSLYILPLKTQVIYGNNRTVEDWNLDSKTESFTYPYKNGVRPVIVPDAGNWLVGTIKENKEPKDWLAEFENSKDNWISRRHAINGVKSKLEDENAQKLMNLALQDKAAFIRVYALSALAPQTAKKWQDKWKADVALMAVNDPSTKVRDMAFYVLGAWKISSSKPDMIAALSDSSYAVAGEALLSLSKLKDDTAYILAKQLQNSSPKGRLRSSAWEIIGDKGNKDDITLFEQQAPYVYGNTKMEFAHALAAYIQNVQDNRSLERASDVFVQLVQTESIGLYRRVAASFYFEAADAVKDRRDNARKNIEKDDAEKKLAILKKGAERIIRDENDDTNLKGYRKMMKKVFGG